VAILQNRPRTALLVVDLQNGVVEGAHERDAVVANVANLVEKARRERVPVVWVQHNDEHLERGSDDWRIVPGLAPDEAEPLVEKSYGDSFEDTPLENVLSDLGVGRLVVVEVDVLVDVEDDERVVVEMLDELVDEVDVVVGVVVVVVVEQY
jgi:nicotinamidase-related amidase